MTAGRKCSPGSQITAWLDRADLPSDQSRPIFFNGDFADAVGAGVAGEGKSMGQRDMTTGPFARPDDDATDAGLRTMALRVAAVAVGVFAGHRGQVGQLGRRHELPQQPELPGARLATDRLGMANHAPWPLSTTELDVSRSAILPVGTGRPWVPHRQPRLARNKLSRPVFPLPIARAIALPVLAKEPPLP